MRAWSAAVIGAAGALAAPVVVIAVLMVAPLVLPSWSVPYPIITYNGAVLALAELPGISA